MKKALVFIPALLFILISCSKKSEKPLRYFQVVTKATMADWRDTSFIVATNNNILLDKILLELEKPVAQRKMVSGELAEGNGGYNKNATHSFGWHFAESNWQLVDVSAEIYDGRAYSDLDVNPNYWFNKMKRFAPWNSYIKKEVYIQ